MRLSRLYAPAEVQLAQVQFSHANASLWQAQLPTGLFDSITQWLADHARSRHLQVHAWSLTPQALRLLVTPPDATALSAVVQAIGRQLAATLRAGGVFAGRYKSALVAPECVLISQVWVESAPQREGCVAQAVDWVWSSAGLHTGVSVTHRPWNMPMTDHPVYWRCGNTPFDRQASYQQRLAAGLTETEKEQIQVAVNGQWALGPESYLRRLGKLATRRVSPGKRGRPPKPTANRSSGPVPN